MSQLLCRNFLFQLIPCLLFPVVTFLLIKELWKTDENRRRMFSSSKSTDSKRTANLVLVFTLTFFIAQFPLGLNSALGYIFIETPGLASPACRRAPLGGAVPSKLWIFVLRPFWSKLWYSLLKKRLITFYDVDQSRNGQHVWNPLFFPNPMISKNPSRLHILENGS